MNKESLVKAGYIDFMETLEEIPMFSKRFDTRRGTIILNISYHNSRIFSDDVIYIAETSIEIQGCTVNIEFNCTNLSVEKTESVLLDLIS